MTDPKDSNLPIGRKWDNTLVPRPKKWSLGRAALYGLVASVALFLIDTIVGDMTGQRMGLSIWLHADPIYLAAHLVGLALLPLMFVIGAVIRNLSLASYIAQGNASEAPWARSRRERSRSD